MDVLLNVVDAKRGGEQLLYCNMLAKKIPKIQCGILFLIISPLTILKNSAFFFFFFFWGVVFFVCGSKFGILVI